MKTIILTAILLSLLIYKTIQDTPPQYSLEYYEDNKQRLIREHESIVKELEYKHALELYKLNAKIEHLK